MKLRRLLLALCLAVGMVSGCAKPDQVMTIKSPRDGIFYTVETFNGSGPADPDFTRVYAHLQRDGKTDKKLVLDGGYLDIVPITWVSSHDVILCLNSGVTNSFRNEVTLTAGSASETIHNHLQEHCDSTSTTSPNATN
jgi:hypothetical protein